MRLCVWCWTGISDDQESLELSEGTHAHEACDTRMREFIQSLGEYTSD